MSRDRTPFRRATELADQAVRVDAGGRPAASRAVPPSVDRESTVGAASRPSVRQFVDRLVRATRSFVQKRRFTRALRILTRRSPRVFKETGLNSAATRWRVRFVREPD